jgi:hypothetical protein
MLQPIPIFLSYPKPYNSNQRDFIAQVSAHLEDNGFVPRTLGVTDYDMDAPLVKIREMMEECCGLLSIAFRRAHIKDGSGKPLTKDEYSICGKWLTSPYCHIEPSMAFQLNMPILIFRESGVIDDGILEKGVVGMYLPEFDLDELSENYFKSLEWNQLISRWKNTVLDYSKLKEFESEEIIQRILGYFSFINDEMLITDLYRAFERSNNDYHSFVRILNVNETFIDYYRQPGHSLGSDYITIHRKYFQ